jgi:hypothetical protein
MHEEIDLVNKLPQDQARKVTNIFSSIHILVHQALEPGQNFRDKEVLQSEIENDIAVLKSILDEVTQDNLKLYIAIFQNQTLGGLINSDRTHNDSAFDLSNFVLSNNSLESLLNINVLSEFGALTAFDLTGRIIYTLTGNNNSETLEFLLSILTFSLIHTEISENKVQDEKMEDTEEEEEVKAVTTTSSNRKISQDNVTKELIISTLPINLSQSNPLTIIDFTG